MFEISCALCSCLNLIGYFGKACQNIKIHSLFRLLFVEITRRWAKALKYEKKEQNVLKLSKQAFLTKKAEKHVFSQKMVKIGGVFLVKTTLYRYQTSLLHRQKRFSLYCPSRVVAGCVFRHLFLKPLEIALEASFVLQLD